MPTGTGRRQGSFPPPIILQGRAMLRKVSPLPSTLHFCRAGKVGHLTSGGSQASWHPSGLEGGANIYRSYLGNPATRHLGNTGSEGRGSPSAGEESAQHEAGGKPTGPWEVKLPSGLI